MGSEMCIRDRAWAEDSDFPAQPSPPPAASAYAASIHLSSSSDEDSMSTSSDAPAPASNASRSPDPDVIAPGAAAVYLGAQNETGHAVNHMSQLYRWTRYGPDRDRTPNRTPKLCAELIGRRRLRQRPCHTLFNAHEIHPADERDWTLVGDRDKELELREIRNKLAEEILRSRRSVQFIFTGNSLHPLVQTDDVTMWEPILDHSKLRIGDVVFCRVQHSI